MTTNETENPLVNYDFSKWQKRAKSLEAPRSGSQLRNEEFDESGLYLDFKEKIKNSDSRIIIVAGSPRIGKSSLVASIWESQEISRITLDSYDTTADLEEDRDVHVIEEIQKPKQVAEFLKTSSAKKTVITSGFRVLDETIEALQEQGMEPEIIFLDLVSEEELTKYVCRVLELKEPDDLVNTIVKMSGGCPFVTNIIMYRFIAAAQMDPKNLNNLKWLTGVKDNIESQITDWDDLREFNEGAFAQYIPNPSVRDFYSN